MWLMETLQVIQASDAIDKGWDHIGVKQAWGDQEYQIEATKAHSKSPLFVTEENRENLQDSPADEEPEAANTEKEDEVAVADHIDGIFELASTVLQEKRAKQPAAAAGLVDPQVGAAHARSRAKASQQAGIAKKSRGRPRKSS